MVILLLPIATFIFFQFKSIEKPQGFEWIAHQGIVAGIVITLWVVSFLLFNKKIKSARKGQGLRDKLEKYFSITIVRFNIFALCGLLLSLAFLFSADGFFTICFIAQLTMCGILWPRSTKVSNDLKLRGDEREMVYYKKDTL
jgi:hypothetical protein